MSRSGYSDDVDNWDLIRWRGAVKSAIRGRRGQAFLKEMSAALEALPAPRLIKDELVRADGEVCAIGAVAVSRGMDVSEIDPHDSEQVAQAFGISHAMASEVMFMNDEAWILRDPEERFQYMRNWTLGEIQGDWRKDHGNE